MSAAQLVQGISWCLYVLIFLLVVARAIRLPTRAHLDMVLFFGATTTIIVLGALLGAVQVAPSVWVSDLTGALLMLLPYLLLRLVADFSRVPTWAMRACELGLGVSLVAIVALPTPMPSGPALLLVAYFLCVAVYDTWAFARQARRSGGVTRRRMQAIAAGTVCLGLVLLVAGLTAALPDRSDLWAPISQVLGLASGAAYFVGFAPPTWLRRVWQEPELRAFLSRAATLPHLPDTPTVVKALESAAAASLGAPAATLGLWQPERQRLRFAYQPPPGTLVEPSLSLALRDGRWESEPTQQPISGRSFLQQRALLVSNLEREDPANASMYRAYQARAALAAPISAGDKRLGVLVIYAPYAPVFAQSDLELLRLLADQAAVILESRSLIDESAHVQAREEAMRLKEDFISSAAHDLKTPLTGLLIQAQVLLRRAELNPLVPIEPGSIERLLREGRRLRSVVLELVDAAQLEPLTAPPARQDLDLALLAADVCAGRPRCRLDAPEPVVGAFDGARIRQVLEHLIDNALTYDPSGQEVQVRVWREADLGRVAVTDSGIGVPIEDVPHLFQRFHRGRNVDDRHYAGLGLGLYLSRRIVEEHGGRIWLGSRSQQGSAFEIELPLPKSPAGGAQPATENVAEPGSFPRNEVPVSNVVLG